MVRCNISFISDVYTQYFSHHVIFTRTYTEEKINSPFNRAVAGNITLLRNAMQRSLL